MTALLTLILVVLAGSYLAVRASAQTAMGLAEFTAKRQAARENVHDARTNRCRVHAGAHFLKRSWQIAVWNRDTNLAMWRDRVVRARALASRCWQSQLWDWYYTSGAKCVREHEGSWTDPNAPYWGGFQADLSFQQAYGAEWYARWGTADNWAPIYQIDMAHRGWLARGWQPWPTTSVLCGLR
jgi:hypothetical protein